MLHFGRSTITHRPMTISFLEPPLNEVVIGKTFAPQAGLLIPHYGKFWELVSVEFPDCEHAVPIVEANSEALTDAKTGLVLPRVWFLSGDRTRLLQLQSDRFYSNWRQTERSEPYERFNSVYEPYRKYASLLQSFFASQLNSELVARRYELTYMNLFRSGKGWNSFGDLNALLQGISLPRDNSLGNLTGGSLRLDYSLAGNQGKVTVSINQVKNTKTLEAAIRMEFAASGPVVDQSADAEDDWFQIAHKAIVEGFCDLTSPDVQKSLWKRVS